MNIEIKLNGQEVPNIESVKNHISLNHDCYDIELNQSDDEWLQVSCENGNIAIARKHKGQVHYYGDYDEHELQKTLSAYCSNPEDCIITSTSKGKAYKQPAIKTLKGMVVFFLFFLILFAFQCFMIVMYSSYPGTFFNKIMMYYWDDAVPLKKKTILLYLVVTFVMCILSGIKALAEKRHKGERKKS